MFFVLYLRRSVQILILNEEGIIEKISYERHAYEHETKRDYLRLCPEKRQKKRIHAFKG